MDFVEHYDRICERNKKEALIWIAMIVDYYKMRILMSKNNAQRL